MAEIGKVIGTEKNKLVVRMYWYPARLNRWVE